MGSRAHPPFSARPFPLTRLDAADRGRTLDVAGYQQARGYTCGFACVLMVLRHYRRELAARDVYRMLGTDRTGTRQTSMVRVLRRAGLSAHVRYDLSFTRLQCAIDRDRLVIGYLFDAEHWVVFYGYGLAPERVFVADPRPQERCVQLLDGYWKRARSFGIVCSPRTRARARPHPHPRPHAPGETRATTAAPTSAAAEARRQLSLDL